MTNRRQAMAAGAFTAAAAVAYWLFVFTGTFVVTELVPGYRSWFMAFPLADAWIATTGIWLTMAAARRHRSAPVAAATLGSSLLFLGLYAALYGAQTGLLFNLTSDELVEIAVKVYCVVVGASLVRFAVQATNRLPAG
jgi:hypothetical protein